MASAAWITTLLVVSLPRCALSVSPPAAAGALPGVHREPPPEAPQAEPPPAERSASPGISGTIVAEHAASLPASRTGILMSVRARRGQRVSRDEVLAELDNERLKVELSIRQAELQVAQAELAQHEVQVSRRRRDLERRHRAQEVSPGSITAEEVEHAEADLAEAEASRDAARARVAEHEAQVRSTQLQLKESVLRAPFAGVVAEQYAELGEAVGPAAPIFRLVAEAPLHVRFDTPPSASLRAGDLVWVQAGPRPILARVQSSAPEVDARTGQIAVDAGLPAGTPLVPGMRVDVLLRGPAPRVEAQGVSAVKAEP